MAVTTLADLPLLELLYSGKLWGHGPVQFTLVDRLLELDPGKSIVMSKQVSLAEEYLADHFPRFPVLPGVLMLEAAIQASAWLVRSTLDFSASVVTLKTARGIRYGAFVAPGHTLQVRAEAVDIQADRSDLKILGIVDGQTAIQGRLELRHINLGALDPAMAAIESNLIQTLRGRWQDLQRDAMINKAVA